MKLVVLTMRLFDQPRSGGELCTARLLRGLEQAGHELTVLGLGQAAARPQARVQQLSVGHWLPPFDDMRPAQRLLMPLQALASGRPATTQRLHGAGSAARVRAEVLARLGEIDGLVVDHLQSLAWVQPLLHRLPPPMVVMHNLESDGYLERALNVRGKGLRARASRWLYRREARLLRRLERLALQQASVIGCLSDADAARLGELAAQHGARVPVEVLPGYTLAAAGAPPGRPADDAGLDPAAVQARLAALPAGRRRIGLLGTWTWEPNRAGLQWLIDQVLPQLPPDCQLVLAGGGLDGLPPRPNTTLLGRIAEASSFYDAVDLVAIPSVRGSGVHEKAIEAIGAGLPVVATPHALRGLMPRLPAHVHLADGAEQFARACAGVPLQRDPAAGQAWAAQRRQDYRAVLQRCLALAATPRPGQACALPARQRA